MENQLYPLYIQCIAPDGTTGTFFKTEQGELVSPVFISLTELYPWAEQNGFRFDTSFDTRKKYPVGAFIKEA